MYSLTFDFNGKIILIDCNENEIMKDICQKFCSKLELDIDSLFFILYEDKRFSNKYFKLDLNESLNSLLFNNNNEKEKINLKLKIIKIIVYSINKNIDEITMVYMLNSNKKIQIFNSIFVEKNKSSCNIIYNDKKYELSEFFEIPKNDENNNDLIQIKLIGIKNIVDISAIFYGCRSLLFLPDILKIDISKYIDLKFLFAECHFLSYISKGISNWNTSNITNLSFLFSNCYSLLSIPDISNWNTKNVQKIIATFQGCPIKCLPDISKWNTENVFDMCFLFSNCHLLVSMPDISKWKINKVMDMSYLFDNCSSLKFLPDISKWKTNTVLNMKKISSRYWKMGYNRFK